MDKHGWIALGLGSFFSLVIGCGLMALMFFSSRGYDERRSLQKEARTTFRVRPRKKAAPGWGCSCGVLSLADVIATFTNIPAERSFLSEVQSVDQRMRLGMRCRLSPTADVPSHTSGAAMCHC